MTVGKFVAISYAFIVASLPFVYLHFVWKFW